MTERQIKIAERKAKAIDLLGEVCAQCGNDGTSGLIRDRLEFDHINNDREDYKHTLANMWDYNWDKVVAELKKCQLLCRHCHAVKSQVDRGGLPFSVVVHGTANAYLNRGCRCADCTKANRDKARNYYRSKRIA
jgi:hypothetical protein